MSFVSPVPNANCSTLGNHGTCAEATLARKIGLSFLALSVYESKLHVWTWLVVAARAVPMQRHGRTSRFGNALILACGCDSFGHNDRGVGPSLSYAASR